ncbi:hypothetical protein D3C71_189820 [compost metagenome]
MTGSSMVCAVMPWACSRDGDGDGDATRGCAGGGACSDGIGLVARRGPEPAMDGLCGKAGRTSRSGAATASAGGGAPSPWETAVSSV